VLGDMIEGVVAANDLPPPAATRLRTDLWELFVPTGLSDIHRVA
jgi:hypothetical protein